MKCERAIIVVGGVGSRNMEWTYANEKCQLPLPTTDIGPNGKLKRVTRSVVDLAVRDCMGAGITDFTIVVGEGAVTTRRAYEGNPAIDKYMKAHGKEQLLTNIKQMGKQATFRFITQPYDAEAPYGTTYPVALAQDAGIVSQPGHTLVVMGDQFFHRPDGSSEAAHLIQSVHEQGAGAGMLTIDVPPEKIDHYGIAHVREDGLLDRIVEKPAVGSIPDCRANASMYLIGEDIIPHIVQNMTDRPDGSHEHQFTDVMNDYASSHPVAVVSAEGTYVDCGTTLSWTAGVAYMAAQADAAMAAAAA